MASSNRKRCNRCGQVFGSEAFNASKRSRDGLAANCRSCVNRRRRELDRQHKQESTTRGVNIVDAARRGQLQIVKAHVSDCPRQLTYLLEKTVQDYHTIKKRPEHVALARFLIQHGARADWSMIGEAARGGQQALIDVLLESGVEPNIFVAAATGDEKMLLQLLEADPQLARAHDKGITPLHYCGMSALGKSDQARAQSLVRCGEHLIRSGGEADARANFEVLEELGPLHCVCWTGGNLPLARLLLDSGAKPAGCLAFALGHFHRHGNGHYDIADLLINAGVDIHDEGDAWLGRFAAHGDSKAVRWLLEHGADPNVQSAEGRTPLHLAAERNAGTVVIKLLLDHGADASAVTVDGHTPLDLAKQNEKRRVVEFLQRAP